MERKGAHFFCCFMFTFTSLFFWILRSFLFVSLFAWRVLYFLFHFFLHFFIFQDQEDSDLFILTSTLPSSSAFPTFSPETSVLTSTQVETLPPFTSSSSSTTFSTSTLTFSSTLPSFTSAPSTLPPSPEVPTTSLSNALFPDLTLLPSSIPARTPPSPPSSSPATPSSVSRLNGVDTFTGKPSCTYTNLPVI